MYTLCNKGGTRLALFLMMGMFYGHQLMASQVTTVKFLDLNKYVGKWYEIASIPQSFQKQCVKNTTAEYSKTNSGLIKVINSCEQSDGTMSVAEGRAKIEDRVSNSKLKVTFVKLIDWIFAFGGNYWVLDVDSNYSYALVGDPSTKYAWLLSRTPKVEPLIFKIAEEKFRMNGYDTCKILTSVQSEGVSKKVPLCEFVKL